MNCRREETRLVAVMALGLLLSACATPTMEVKRAYTPKYVEWTYVNTKIAPRWWYSLLKLDTIHKRATGKDRIIAIVDTGVLDKFEDVENILPGVATCSSKPADTNDTNGHGTQLAGIAVGKDPGPGYLDTTPQITSGVAKAGKLLPIKIDCGVVSTDALVKGVQAAVDNKAEIVLLALGGYPPGVDAALKMIVTSTAGQAVLFVVASVWDNDTYPFPDWTNSDNVLITAPMTLVDGAETPFNDRQVGQIWAPGRDIDTASLATFPNPDAGNDPRHPTLQAPILMQGTSAAAAIVAGCAALVKEKTTYAGARLKTVLVSTATNKQALPPNGRLDCDRAVP